MTTENSTETDPLDGGGLGELSKHAPMEPTWRDGRSPDPSRMCTARRTNGEPCRRIAVLGAVVCPAHGGSAPQVKAAARVRIERAADRMARELLRIAVDEETPAATRLLAIKDALDRGGLGAKTAVEVQVGPTAEWENILSDTMMAGGSRAESRAARGIADNAPPVLDAEVVGDSGLDPEQDGFGRSTGATVPNNAPQQRRSPGPDGNAGNAAGAGGGTGMAKPRQGLENDLSGTPIVSLDEAHPDAEPRRNPKKRNRAISPKHHRERF